MLVLVVVVPLHITSDRRVSVSDLGKKTNHSKGGFAQMNSEIHTSIFDALAQQNLPHVSRKFVLERINEVCGAACNMLKECPFLFVIEMSIDRARRSLIEKGAAIYEMGCRGPPVSLGTISKNQSSKDIWFISMRQTAYRSDELVRIQCSRSCLLIVRSPFLAVIMRIKRLCSGSQGRKIGNSYQ
jgi:hypothetical protein